MYNSDLIVKRKRSNDTSSPTFADLQEEVHIPVPDVRFGQETRLEYRWRVERLIRQWMKSGSGAIQDLRRVRLYVRYQGDIVEGAIARVARRSDTRLMKRS